MKKATYAPFEFCSPPKEMWDKHSDKANYSKYWEMDHLGFIYFVAPSLEYVCLSDLIGGGEFKNFIKNAFRNLEDNYHLDFESNLIIEDHKAGCHYYFKTKFIWDELLGLATKHHEGKL